VGRCDRILNDELVLMERPRFVFLSTGGHGSILPEHGLIYQALRRS